MRDAGGRKGGAAVIALLLAWSVAQAARLTESFEDDPFVDYGDGSPLFERRGPEEAFIYEAGTPPAFEGDPPGSLLVRYDSLEPTARAFVRLPRALAEDRDFVASAVFVIRSANFAADPSGFMEISFGLMSLATTGDDRTGDLSDFRADTFDTLEFDYFPNVSPFFGGPFTGGAAFGGAVGGDAFANFTYATVPLELPLDAPLEARLTHRASQGTLEVSVARVLQDGTRAPLLTSPVALRTGDLAPGFTVDALGIFAYHDGFNELTGSGRSLRADVDYHLLSVEYEAPIPVVARISPDPLFASTRGRFVRARLAPVSAADAPALAALAGDAPPVSLWLGAADLAEALSAEYDTSSGELVVFFDAARVLDGVGSARGEIELALRGAVEGSGRVFILGTASGSGGNPGRRRAR